MSLYNFWNAPNICPISDRTVDCVNTQQSLPLPQQQGHLEEEMIFAIIFTFGILNQVFAEEHITWIDPDDLKGFFF